MHLSPREAHSLRLGPDAEARPERAAVHLHPDQVVDPDPPNPPPEPRQICPQKKLSHA